MSSDTGDFDLGLPGEQIRLRFPARGTVYLVAWAVVGVLAVGGLYQLLSGKPVHALVGEFIGPIGVIGLFAAGLIVFYTRWRILVTNRRIMMRPGFLTWKHQELRLEEVEAVGFGNDRISIRGRNGKEIGAKILALGALGVAEAMGVRHGMRKVADQPPEIFLVEGEAIRHLEPGAWESRLLRFNWPILVGFVAGWAVLGRMFDPPDWIWVPFLAAFIFLQPWHLPWRPVPWRLAVTDRRLLARWNMAGGPYLEEISFDRITRIRYDKTHRELILDGPRCRVAIACGRRRANRILAAMGCEAESIA